MTQTLALYLLGEFRLERDGIRIQLPRRKVESLLAYLVLHPQVHAREKLAALLWGETGDAQARASLRNALPILRKELGDKVLLTDRDTVQLNPEFSLQTDAVEFLQAAPTPDLQPAEIENALALYRGDLLPDYYDDWIILEREHLLVAFQELMSRHLEYLVETQNWDAVPTASERWIRMERTPEPAYCALMLSHAQRGDRAQVGATYQRCVNALRDELGVEPSGETRALYEQLATGETPSTLARALARSFEPNAIVIDENAAPAPGEPPYKGLHYFDPQDAHWFFGREQLVARLVGHLRTHRFLAVIVGASGSGKSSLVRAGLLPALQHDTALADGTLPPSDSLNWQTHLLTPTAAPLQALASALAEENLSDQAGSYPFALKTFAAQQPLPLLLVVDQFEELFALCSDEAQRRAFIDNLLNAVTPTGVENIHNSTGVRALVITLRADFYARCAQYENLRDAVAAHQLYIGAMSAAEMRRAIEEPARRGRWSFESGLVDVMLRDAGQEPGALPLLSHALLETWSRRRGRVMTLQGYAEAGGVRGAIARTAETVFNQQLTPEQQEIARRLFLRLTEFDEAELPSDTRRRATLSELHWRDGDTKEVENVLRVLSTARLITIDENSVEVAHEALLNEWQRLGDWRTQDREALRLHRQLTQAALEWDGLAREASALYRGTRLAQAREWAQTHAQEMNATERAFLDASEENENREAKEREAQRERELAAAQALIETRTRAAKQLRRRALILAGALALALILAFAAIGFGNQARVNESIAQENANTASQAQAAADKEKRIASARELAAASENNLSVDPERSILLALQAINTTESYGEPILPEAEAAVHRAIQTSRVLATLTGHTNSIISVVASPNGKRLATLSDDETVKIWDTASAKELVSIQTGLTAQNILRTISFSPDGKRITAPAGAHQVKIWDVETGKELLTLSGHTDEVTAAIFSPDGALIATGSVDTTAKLWDAATGRELVTFKGHSNGISTVAFSPGGDRLYTGSDLDGLGIAWETAAGKQLFTFDNEGGLDSIAVSPDGTRLATGEFDTSLKIWNAATGEKLLTLFGHASYLNGVAYSLDGKRLASTSEDGTTKLWDAETGKALLTLSGHTSGVENAAFSPDGNTLYTASRDGTVKVWDVSPTAGSDFLNLAGHTNRVRSLAYRPDGKQLATLGYDGMLKIWDAANGKEMRTITLTNMIESMNSGGNAFAGGVSFSPDGKRLAYNDLNIAKIVDANSGAEILSLALADSAGNDVAFSPDGTRIAIGSQNSGLGIYNNADGKMLIQFPTGSGYNGRIAFSPDSTRIASANDDGANVWDVVSGKKLVTFTGHGPGVGINGIAYRPDGKWIATAGNDGTVRVWDSTTGAEIFNLKGHSGPTFGVAFSPDGQSLATSSVDRTVKIWQLPREGDQVPEPLTLYGNTGAVYEVAFSPDGTRVISVGRDRIVRVYELKAKELIAIAKARLTRALTLQECQTFLHLETCPPVQ